MKKTFLLAITYFLFLASIQGQKFFTKNGKITFFSSTAAEDIEGVTRSAVAVLDSRTGDLQFAVLIKSFEFKKALMQEHFNENYIESDKYPRSEFKGVITNNAAINYATDGSYPASAHGTLSLHGHSKQIDVTGTITIRNGTPSLASLFQVKISDFGITVPRIHRDNISSTIRITVDCPLNPVK